MQNLRAASLEWGKSFEENKITTKINKVKKEIVMEIMANNIANWDIYQDYLLTGNEWVKLDWCQAMLKSDSML